MSVGRATVSYSGLDKSHASFNASLVAQIVLGLSLMFAGIFQANTHFNFIEFDSQSFLWCNNIFSILLLIFALYSMKNKIITEGMFYLLCALRSVLFTLAGLYGESVQFLFLYFVVGYLGCLLIFRSRGERWMMVSSAVFIIYSLLVNLAPFEYLYIYGSIMAFYGALLIIVGCVTMVEIDFGLFRRHPPMSMNISDRDYPEMFESTIGTMLLAIITFLYVYAVYHNYDVSTSYYIFTTIVSVMTIVAAVYGIYHGVIGQTVLMFLLALSKLIFTIFGYLGMGTTTHVDLTFAIIIIPLIVTFFVKKQYLVALLTFATTLTAVAEVFTGAFFIVELGMALTNIAAIYLALDTWYYAEVGMRISQTPLVRKVIGGLPYARR